MSAWNRTAFKVKVLSACVLLAPISAFAQGDWLKKGKDVLGGQEGESSLSTEEMGKGIKEALRVGSSRVIEQLGQEDGFNLDEKVRIPLPDQLGTVKSSLERIGLDSLLEQLELRLNRAAEEAAPKAKELFMAAIDEMTLDDVKDILTGEEDAATKYFQGKMSEPLADAMRPIVDQSLKEVGADQAFDKVMSKYRSLPFTPSVEADLTEHVVSKGMEGIFYHLAREEAAIRKDPAKRTSEILERVFSAVD